MTRRPGSEVRKSGQKNYQARQYGFPYHYIPELGPPLFLARHWGFAASYIAALNIVSEQLKRISAEENMPIRHVDIGCGDGAFLNFLAKKDDFKTADMTGIDIDSRALDWARLFNPGITFMRPDEVSNSAKYVSATAIEVIEHIEPDGLKAFVDTVHSILAPGGYFIVTVPSTTKPLAKKHYQHFTREGLAEVLETSFEILEITGFERNNIATRIIRKLRMNGTARVDMPILNRILVRQFQRQYRDTGRCGRLMAIVRKTGR